jgi:hypothetical protein
VADKPHDLPTMPGTVQVPSGDTLDDSGSTSPLFATVVPVTNQSDVMAPLLAAPTLPAAWRYQMKAEIARGGMGRVVEADDGVLGRVVALKEALSRDPDSLRRFERETRITARLEHPSIVPVHDAGVSPSGAPFYVMRKISGRPLEELVATRGALEQRLELLPNIVAAAHAIAHAHERGVVHRDIKPANILVGDLGETIVIDWARQDDRRDRRRPRSPRAPERRPLDHRRQHRQDAGRHRVRHARLHVARTTARTADRRDQ